MIQKISIPGCWLDCLPSLLQQFLYYKAVILLSDVNYYTNEEAPSNTGVLRCPVVPNKNSSLVDHATCRYKQLQLCLLKTPSI